MREPSEGTRSPSGGGPRQASGEIGDRLAALIQGNEELALRLLRIRDFSRRIRPSEYHITNACNLRCKDCWFFEYAFEKQTRDEASIAAWQDFVKQQADAGVTAPLLIGGEPTLYPERIEAFVQEMDYVTISTNGVIPFPTSGFERVAVAITLFGGSGLDDRLRGFKPSGSALTGLFDTTLENYRKDPRATFIYALRADAIDLLEETVQKIEDNGNQVTFNYYTAYTADQPVDHSGESELLEEALRVHSRHPETVVCDEYFIRTVITGETEFGSFGYGVCPSISVSHPAHERRLRNGNPVLPRFNVYAPDLETVNFCCTSGHCAACRDSQAVFSWLLISLPRFLTSVERLETWVDVAESYWRQFVWSPYHRSSPQGS